MFIFISVSFRYVGRYLGVPGKVISIGVIALDRLAQGRLSELIVSKAANDAALAVVRRAAANEAQFALRAGAR